MNTMKYERYDECYGRVTSRCRSGAFVELDNGESAFAYKYANLVPGSKVICSILKPAAENLRTMVSITTVLEYAA